MAANVEECTHSATGAAHDDQAFIANRRKHVVARLRNLLRTPDTNPMLIEDALALRAEDLIGSKVGSWQRVCAGWHAGPPKLAQLRPPLGFDATHVP